MSPRRSSSSTSPGTKISVPGVVVSDLLEIEDSLPEVKTNLARTLYIVVLIAQVRASIGLVKPAVVQGLESVNFYIKNFLAKSPEVTYLAASVAMRRTMAAHVNDADDSKIKADHLDLCQNLSGKVSKRGGMSAALANDEKLRAYRRGLMAEFVGNVQSTPIFYPRRISQTIESLQPKDYYSYLPFDTSALKFVNIPQEINERILSLSDGNPIVFSDLPCVPTGKVLFEDGLVISRVAPSLPDVSKLPKDVSSLPAWKQAAINQAKNLQGGA